METLTVVLGTITLKNVLFLVGGSFCGIIGGALPGISPSMTIALLLPMSLYLPPSYAIMMLIGAYQGAMYGGSISAILINTPGTASAAATAFDGYQMANNGKAGKALGMALTASCSGGLISSIILICLAKSLANLSIQFGPAEYFGIMVLPLTLIAGV
ncbi:tripartite tricarboxylate transporter permease, partial [Pyramidobacter porci]